MKSSRKNHTASFKQSLLPAYKSAAKQYKKLIGLHTVVICSDGFKLDVLWEKQNFMHLCGVYCDRPNSVARAGISEQNYFYDRLFEPNLSAKLIHFEPNNFTKIRNKSQVLSSALNYEHWRGCLIVDSRLRRIEWFLGDDSWSLGLGVSNHASMFTNGPVCFPMSLRKQSVNKLLRQDGDKHVVVSIQLL